MSEARLTAKASTLARKGQPWFFGDDVASCAAERPGLVRVRDAEQRDLGVGLWSPEARIKLRLAGSWDEVVAIEADAFFATRIATAVGQRAGLRGPRRGVRLVHAEADRLPGLVADEYGDGVVVQITAAALESMLSHLVPALMEATGASWVLARNDLAVRRFEGLPEEVRLLHGRRVEEVTIEEQGVAFPVRPWTGHKTGFYLDQRPARTAVRALANGRRVLDLFCYQGGFALAALSGGATSALAIDASEDALGLARRTAETNGLGGLETRCGNAFEVLRELQQSEARFDLIVVDPPAFAKSKREKEGAVRGYRDLNRRALRLLAPGGVLVTATCSHHVDRATFEDVLRQAAAGLPFRMMLRHRLMAGDDHPVWLALPESEYLKVCVLERVDD